MLSRSRVPRTLGALLISLTLAVSALIPLGGVASAVPLYDLEISAPTTATVDQTFEVQVEIIGADGCALTVPVTLTASKGEALETWSENAFRGTATFPDVSLGSIGTWDLNANAYLVDCAEFSAAPLKRVTVGEDSEIPPGQPAAPCPPGDVTCERVWNLGNTAATLIARSGDFTDPVPGFVDNSNLKCGNGRWLEDNSVLEYGYVGEKRQRIIFGLDRSLIKKPLWRHNVCWHSDKAFVPRRGGEPVNTGLLRRCRWGVPAPCVLFKRWVRGGALIGVLVPPGDPRGYVR